MEIVILGGLMAVSFCFGTMAYNSFQAARELEEQTRLLRLIDKKLDNVGITFVTPVPVKISDVPLPVLETALEPQPEKSKPAKGKRK